MQTEPSYSFTIRVAGVAIRFEAPFRLEIPPEFRPFLSECGTPQIQYTIELLRQPQNPEDAAVFHSLRQSIFRRPDGWLHVYPPLKSDSGCVPALLLRSSNSHILYLPADDLERYRKNCTLSGLIAAEAALLPFRCMILHSSVITLRGEAILFSGAPGVGKSTQAELWRSCLNAEILNGDRCVISAGPAGFSGCGSPYCGSSGILRQGKAPIRAIVLPVHAAENKIRRLSPPEAFRKLYPHFTVNPWDPVFMDHLTQQIAALVQACPVYELLCLPNEEAVHLAERNIYNTGKAKMI